MPYSAKQYVYDVGKSFKSQIPKFKCFSFVLQLSLLNPLKPGVKSKPKM